MYKITDEKIKKAKRELAKMSKEKKWDLIEKSFGMWADNSHTDGNANWDGFFLTNQFSKHKV